MKTVVSVPAQIWVNSPHCASGYYTIYGEESLQADHFNTKLSFGEPHTLWARTGYLGFIKRTELLDASGGERPFGKKVDRIHLHWPLSLASVGGGQSLYRYKPIYIKHVPFALSF